MNKARRVGNTGPHVIHRKTRAVNKSANGRTRTARLAAIVSVAVNGHFLYRTVGADSGLEY